MRLTKSDRGFASTNVLVIVLVVVAIVGLGYLLISRSDNNDDSSNSTSNQSNVSSVEATDLGVRINDPENRSITLGPKSEIAVGAYLVRDGNEDYFARCEYPVSISALDPTEAEMVVKDEASAKFIKQVGSTYYYAGYGSHSQEHCDSATDEDFAYQDSLREYVVSNLEAL